MAIQFFLFLSNTNGQKNKKNPFILNRKMKISNTICQVSRYNLDSKPQIQSIAVNRQVLNFRGRNNNTSKVEHKIFVEASLQDTNLLLYIIIIIIIYIITNIICQVSR
jgi:hypothetical protein